MRPLRIFASEFGAEPYASAIRYNALVRSFSNRGGNYNISVVAASGDTKGYEDIIDRFWSLGINCREGSFPLRVVKEVCYGMFCLASLVFDSKKLILITAPNFISSIIIISACRLLRIPFCVDVRDLCPDVYAIGGAIATDGLLYSWLDNVTRSQYRAATKVFVTTHGLKEKLVERGIPIENIEVITNGYPKALCSEVGRDVEQFNRDVVLHGTLGKMQNIKFLAEIIRRLPDFSFTIVGGGNSINQLTREDFSNVVLVDRVSQAEALKIVLGHKVGLCIRKGNYYDSLSMPVKIFEYLGLGLKVISFPKTEFSRDANLKELIHEFECENVESVCEGIKAMISRASDCRNEPPEYLAREFQSDLFREQIVKQLL